MTQRCTSRFIVCVTSILLILIISAAANSAGKTAKVVAHYKVSSKGFSIGDVTTIQRPSDEGGVPSLAFETKTSVNASFLWMSFHLDTIEKGTLQKGELVSYTRKGQDNGTSIDVEGRLEQSSFRFEAREAGKTHVIVIPRTSYDYTTMECPEARIDFSDKPHITLKILDVEKMAVVNREYRLVRNSHYTVAGKEYPCRIVDYTDQNKKARRWSAWDGSTMVMFRQDGKGRDSYSVQATSVSREL